MNRKTVLAAGFGTMMLILDSRCAADSARQALELCIKTVIPSLFPMFVLSGLLISGISVSSGRFLSLPECILGLPPGTGALFLLGIIGGFPVGAQCISQAVESNNLSRLDGERMLGFCNNCSPAFLFGIAGGLFSDLRIPALIFLIQLESAMLVARFTAFDAKACCTVKTRPCTLPDAVLRATKSMISVCAWVVLAGVVTGFLKRWVFPLLPMPAPQIVTGLLEVTGGVLALAEIPERSLRFLLSAVFVCFGGFSVWMQIQALAFPQGLATAVCFRQKTVQAILGGLLSLLILGIGPVVLLLPPVILMLRKKTLEKPIQPLYNGIRKGGFDHVVS